MIKSVLLWHFLNEPTNLNPSHSHLSCIEHLIDFKNKTQANHLKVIVKQCKEVKYE
jgi:hypothetical protein